MTLTSQPGAGLECSDTPEVPPPHNLTASLRLRGCANLFPDTNHPTLRAAIMETCSPWQRSRTYERAVTLTQRTQSGHFYPSNQAFIRFSSRRTFQLTSGWSGLAACPISRSAAQRRSAGAHPRRVTRIRKTRRWHLSPDSHCHMHDAPSTVLEQASARSGKMKEQCSSSTSARCTRPSSSLPPA
ncbi:hypothetical protein EDB84DRAFT_146831 [Lactarius hengduanensis]|nr:hypothetical protein EDB84DRAFT_146831 [Lactarius hengduanensis]